LIYNSSKKKEKKKFFFQKKPHKRVGLEKEKNEEQKLKVKIN
jgi:hypothetical protein